LSVSPLRLSPEFFVGFDDNRSLGNGETGTLAAAPVFTEFMKEATKGMPKTDFKAPRNAKFIMVHGIREAFRPGTEPKVAETPWRHARRRAQALSEPARQ